MKKFCAGLGLILPGTLAAQPAKIPDLLPPHGEIAPTFLERHEWQMVAGGVAAIGLVVLAIAWMRRARPVMLEPPAVVARRALEKLRGRAEDGPLIVEVCRTLKHFVLATMNLPVEELTTAEFQSTVKGRPQISEGATAAMGDFLRRCDEWKFAPSRSGPQLRAVETAVELVARIEGEKSAAGMTSERKVRG